MEIVQRPANFRRMGFGGALTLVVVLLVGPFLVQLPLHAAPAPAAPGSSLPGITTSSLTRVQFNETGLPGGARWTVVLVGPEGSFANESPAGGATLTLFVPVGNYSLSLVTSPGGYGAPFLPTYVVVRAVDLNVVVPFVAVYPILFQEQGLPLGFGWNITVRSTNLTLRLSASTPNATVATITGPFNFTIYSIGFNATPSNGGGRQPAGRVFAIQFLPLTPPIYYGIVEGIVNVGTLATVYVGGYPRTVHPGGSFDAILPPGTYPVLATAEGYTTFYEPAAVAANGSADVAITLLPLNSSGPGANTSSDSPGLSYLDGLGMGAVIGGAVVAAAYFAWRWRDPLR